MMLMALRSGDEIVGTVGFDMYSRDREITTTIDRDGETMIAQVAIGLQNKRLLSDAQRRAEQLQRVATFGQSMQAALQLETILNILLSESAQMLPMDRMTVAFHDPHREQLHVVGQYADGEISIDLDGDAPLSMTEALIRQAWETGEMLTIADTQPSAADSDGVKDKILRSVMVAPIRSRGRLLGIVSAGSFMPYSYSETDQAIYQQMIYQLAVALENAEAYRQSQRVAQNEALINNIATHFQQHSAVEDMLQIAINELGQALGARRGRIRLSMHGDGE